MSIESKISIFFVNKSWLRCKATDKSKYEHKAELHV